MIFAGLPCGNGTVTGWYSCDQERTSYSVPDLEPDVRLLPLKATPAMTDIQGKGLEDLP
jgi:hypothetical protein